MIHQFAVVVQGLSCGPLFVTPASPDFLKVFRFVSSQAAAGALALRCWCVSLITSLISPHPKLSSPHAQTVLLSEVSLQQGLRCMSGTVLEFIGFFILNSPLILNELLNQASVP